MSSEENKAIVRGLIQAENDRNYSLFDEFLAPDFVSNISDTPTPGREIYKQGVKTFVKAFPDFHGTIQDIIADGDKVWISYKGTTLAPTGKKVTMTSVSIYRIVDSKIVEMHSFLNMDFFIAVGHVAYTEKGKKLFQELVE